MQVEELAYINSTVLSKAITEMSPRNKKQSFSDMYVEYIYIKTVGGLKFLA